jgi:ribosomal protein S18 acetylase RimI-like enzyme
MISIGNQQNVGTPGLRPAGAKGCPRSLNVDHHNHMIAYSQSLDAVTDADLTDFLAHWDFTPPSGTLLAMLKGSTYVILARDESSSILCGYITALSDDVVCSYISAIEVRPAYRHQGIGTALLTQMTNQLQTYGTYLSCAPEMAQFYESQGFKQIVGMSKRRFPSTK